MVVVIVNISSWVNMIGINEAMKKRDAKYGGTPKSMAKNKNNVDDDDPLDDAAFERIQAEIMKNKKKSKK